jgi:predicted transcriptional regulator
MNYTKQSILNYKTLLPGIEGYLTVVSKIESNINSNPDIAIESCKSLIEGLCKKALELLSDEYNEKKTIRKTCDNSLPDLVRIAFNQVYKKSFEIDIHTSLFNLLEKHEKSISVQNKIQNLINVNSLSILENLEKSVVKLSVIRDTRGDISHGRIYPKREESGIHLSKSIASITDGICSFMIEEIAIQYKEKYKRKDRLDYENKDLENFNLWLDNLHDVSSIKIDFSKLLYENAYDKYEEYYYLEYIPSNEILDESIESKDTITDTITKHIEREFTELVTNFEEEKFWTAARSLLLEKFANQYDFEINGLKEIIEKYIAFDDEPLRDDIAKIMINKPTLSERKKTLLVMMEFIIDFAEDLKK